MVLALLWFAAGFSGSIQAACDIDNDGDVDRLDLEIIVGARGTRSTGPGDSRDADADGAITMLGARACVRQCSRPHCKKVVPLVPAADNDSGRPSSAGQGSAIAGGRRWTVKRGETLYSIGRAVFPRDTARQARFRQDVMTLNPSVFANGADNMAVGAVLVLPDYAGSGSTAVAAGRPVQVTPAVADKVTALPAPQPTTAGEALEPPPQEPREPAPIVEAASKPEAEMRVVDEPAASAVQSIAAAQQATASASISLGYSGGGDRLENTGEAADLDAGSGAQMRLGFEHMFARAGGYRVAFGLQYSLARDNGDSATFRDAYLQLAYQRYSGALVYGVGIVLHTGATLKQEITREYEPAAGALLYLENAGNGVLSGWGLSYTSLQIEEQNVGESIDASRAEVYYSWRF